jgi:transcriptional regulator with XRE-family HTH domain
VKTDFAKATISGIPVEKLLYFGELIRRERYLGDMSLRSLARIVRRSPSYLSKLERGQVVASAELYVSICEAVGIKNTREILDDLGVMDPKTRELAGRAFRIDPAAFRAAVHEINTREATRA